MTELSTLSVAASGMEAQRAALDVDARNVAAAETGAAYDRLVPRFAVSAAQDGGDPAFGDALAAAERAVALDGTQSDDAPFVRFAGTSVERGAGVDAVEEMVAILNAQRAYEADASVFDTGKRLAERTIEMGRP
jgi:flagellar basal-body rod protein FlgC